MTNLVLKRIDDLALRNRCPCPLNKIVVKPNQKNFDQIFEKV